MNLKKRFSLPIYFILIGLAGLIGLLEAGIGGLIVGLASGVLCSLVSLVGIVPFAGIPLYLMIGNGFKGLLAGLGIVAPVSQAFAFYSFLIFVIITNIFVSALVFLILLALLVSLLRRRA